MKAVIEIECNSKDWPQLNDTLMEVATLGKAKRYSALVVNPR